MKKLMLMILSVLLLVSLCSCGNSKPVDMSKIETDEWTCGKLSYKVPKEWERKSIDGTDYFYATPTDFLYVQKQGIDNELNDETFKYFYESMSESLGENSKIINTGTEKFNDRTFYVVKVKGEVSGTSATITTYVTAEGDSIYVFNMGSYGKNQNKYEGYLKGIVETIEPYEKAPILKMSANEFINLYTLKTGRILELIINLDCGDFTNYVFENEDVRLMLNEDNETKNFFMLTVSALKNDNNIFAEIISVIDNTTTQSDVDEIIASRTSGILKAKDKNGILYSFTELEQCPIMSVSKLK